MVIPLSAKEEIGMDLTECILTRKSIRAYKATPVPKEILTRIMDEARRCTSCANTQPWEIAVIGGQAMEELKKAQTESFLSGVMPNPDISYPSASSTTWPEPYHSRRVVLSRQMRIKAGIDHDDKKQNREYSLKGYTFYGAPNGIIIYIDSSLSEWTIMDVGSFLETILLLAHNYGLGCCPLLQAVSWPDNIRRVLHIPDSKMIVVGLCIGYPDEDDITVSGKHMTDRIPVAEIVTWHGV